MTKTGQEIEDDIFYAVKNSTVATSIDGDVYKDGMRPKDSTKEDAVVKFVAGTDGQIQKGSVVVNIYVPNLDVYGDGVLRKNIARCKAIEAVGAQWAGELPSEDYLFSSEATIQTFSEPELNQHFVSIRLKYQRITT